MFSLYSAIFLLFFSRSLPLRLLCVCVDLWHLVVSRNKLNWIRMCKLNNRFPCSRKWAHNVRKIVSKVQHWKWENMHWNEWESCCSLSPTESTTTTTADRPSERVLNRNSTRKFESFWAQFHEPNAISSCEMASYWNGLYMDRERIEGPNDRGSQTHSINGINTPSRATAIHVIVVVR